MKLFNTFRGLVFSSLVAFSGVASATVIEFNNTSTGFLESVVGNIDLTIEAGTFESKAITLGGLLDVSNGLGIISGEDDASQIDGAGVDEVLVFTFSEEVSFSAIEFFTNTVTRAARNQNDFSFASVENLQLTTLVDDVRIDNNVFVFDTPFVGTSFAIAASERNDIFTIGSISVSALAVNVAEPSTLLIFALGLMGLGLRSRRSL